MTYQELESHCGNCLDIDKCINGFNYIALGKEVIKTDFECEHQTELAAYIAERVDYKIWEMIGKGELI